MLLIRALVIVIFAARTVPALTIDMVPVGNAGNAPDSRYNSISVGSVGTAYQIGKYEVTASQYTEFLNAVAKDDPNGLYHSSMAISSGLLGTNIQRSGSSPNFSYSVAAISADRPVNLVTFWDAVRFANWLHNGQPTGPQGPGTTEDGAYHDVGSQTLFGRNTGANFFLPTDDEWYKAAYHDKSAGLAAAYFDYSTGTNTVPGNNINETTNAGNNANYFSGSYAVGSPHFRTVVGEFELSVSPYGTFDQGGNVFEWNETAVTGSSRSIRGGSFFEAASSTNLQASSFLQSDPTLEYFDVGFRVASASEPDASGDFNHDGFIDGADYVVWRNDPARTQPQYDLWRAHFGQTAGSGANALIGSPSNVVPEPNAAALCGVMLGLVGLLRRSARCRSCPVGFTSVLTTSGRLFELSQSRFVPVGVAPMRAQAEFRSPPLPHGGNRSDSPQKLRRRVGMIYRYSWVSWCEISCYCGLGVLSSVRDQFEVQLRRWLTACHIWRVLFTNDRGKKCA